MDSFYYNLLNIGKQKQEYSDYIKVIDRIVKEETKELKQYSDNLECLCKVVSNNINLRLKELNYDTKIVNTKELYGIYEHEFVLSSYVDNQNNINYILIDPTYIQFKNNNLTLINLEEYPTEVLKKTPQGINLLNNLTSLVSNLIFVFLHSSLILDF